MKHSFSEGARWHHAWLLYAQLMGARGVASQQCPGKWARVYSGGADASIGLIDGRALLDGLVMDTLLGHFQGDVEGTANYCTEFLTEIQGRKQAGSILTSMASPTGQAKSRESHRNLYHEIGGDRLMPGRPAHFNYIRLIGRLEGIHKAHQHINAFLLRVDGDGDPCKVVIWPRPPVPQDLMVGDLIEAVGCLKYDCTDSRKALHYLDARVELVRRGTPAIAASGNGAGVAGAHT